MSQHFRLCSLINAHEYRVGSMVDWVGSHVPLVTLGRAALEGPLTVLRSHVKHPPVKRGLQPHVAVVHDQDASLPGSNLREAVWELSLVRVVVVELPPLWFPTALVVVVLLQAEPPGCGGLVGKVHELLGSRLSRVDSRALAAASRRQTNLVQQEGTQPCGLR